MDNQDACAGATATYLQQAGEMLLSLGFAWGVSRAAIKLLFGDRPLGYRQIVAAHFVSVAFYITIVYLIGYGDLLIFTAQAMALFVDLMIRLRSKSVPV